MILNISSDYFRRPTINSQNKSPHITKSVEMKSSVSYKKKLIKKIYHLINNMLQNLDVALTQENNIAKIQSDGTKSPINPGHPTEKLGINGQSKAGKIQALSMEPSNPQFTQNINLIAPQSMAINNKKQITDILAKLISITIQMEKNISTNGKPASNNTTVTNANDLKIIENFLKNNKS